MLTLSAVLRVEQGGHASDKGILAGPQLGQRGALFQGLLFRLPGNVHQTTGGVKVQLGGLPVPVGSRLAVVGNRCHDQGRVDRLELAIAQSQSVHDSRREALHQHICGLDQLEEDFAALLGFEVQRQALFGGVQVEEPGPRFAP